MQPTAQEDSDGWTRQCISSDSSFLPNIYLTKTEKVLDMALAYYYRNRYHYSKFCQQLVCYDLVSPKLNHYLLPYYIPLCNLIASADEKTMAKRTILSGIVLHEASINTSELLL